MKLQIPEKSAGLTLGHAARVIGISDTLARRLADNGVLKCVRDSAGNRIIDRQSAEAEAKRRKFARDAE